MSARREDIIRDAVATVKFSIQPGTHDNDGTFTNKEPVDANKALDLLLEQLGLAPVPTKELFKYNPDGVDDGTGDLTAGIRSKISGKKYRVYERTAYQMQLDDATITAYSIEDLKRHLGHYESWRGMTHFSPEGTHYA